MIETGARVEVLPNPHNPDVPSGHGVVVRAYVQTAGGSWQHVFVVRLDDGRTVDAPSRFVVED